MRQRSPPPNYIEPSMGSVIGVPAPQPFRSLVQKTQAQPPAQTLLQPIVALRRQSAPARYLVAAATALFAAAAQRLLWPYIPPSPQLLFYPAILFAAWFGGFGPGVLAVALSCGAIVYCFLPPVASLQVDGIDDLVDLLVFAVMGLTLSWLMSSAVELAWRAKQAWLAARAASERLEQASQAREEMLAIVSHDVRSPLHSISLSMTQILNALQRGGTAERIREAAERVGRSVARIDGLLRNLIDVAALDAGPLQLAPSIVDVRGLVDDTVLMFEPFAEQKSVRLLVDASTSESVVCDRERILQVLENMIGNALKFVPSGGVISVTAREQPGEMLFEVRDSGPGIAPENVARIFDRNWKSGAAAGTGLGLYIAKAIVDAHRGHIWARGGTSTTVAFTLPRTGRRLPDEAARSPNGSNHAPFTAPT